MAESWSVKGKIFESCNCEALCPCIMLSPPTEGECTALVGWRVDEGSMGDVDLAGLNVVLAVHSPGNMADGGWRVALYLDERGSEDQRQALTRIFGGQAGGHLGEVVSAFVGDVLGVSTVAIDCRLDGETKSMRIPDVGETEFAAIEGQGGGPVTFSGHPLAIAPGHSGTVSRSTHLRYDDHGMSWELSGKNAFFADFTYQGP